MPFKGKDTYTHLKDTKKQQNKSRMVNNACKKNNTKQEQQKIHSQYSSPVTLNYLRTN